MENIGRIEEIKKHFVPTLLAFLTSLLPFAIEPDSGKSTDNKVDQFPGNDDHFFDLFPLDIALSHLRSAGIVL